MAEYVKPARAHPYAVRMAVIWQVGLGSVLSYLPGQGVPVLVKAIQVQSIPTPHLLGGQFLKLMFSKPRSESQDLNRPHRGSDILWVGDSTLIGQVSQPAQWRVSILPRDTSVMPRGQGDVDQWKIIHDRARADARRRPCLVPEKEKSAWDTSEHNGGCSQLSVLLKGKQDPLPTPVLLQSFQQLLGAGRGYRPLHPCGLFSLSSSQKNGSWTVPQSLILPPRRAGRDVGD